VGAVCIRRSLEEERGSRPTKRDKSGAEQVRHAEEAELGVRGLDDHNEARNDQQLDAVGQRLKPSPGPPRQADGKTHSRASAFNTMLIEAPPLHSAR